MTMNTSITAIRVRWKRRTTANRADQFSDAAWVEWSEHHWICEGFLQFESLPKCRIHRPAYSVRPRPTTVASAKKRRPSPRSVASR